MEKKELEEKLYSLTSPLKPSQFAIEEGAKSDGQIINEIVELVFQELDKAREEGRKEALEEVLNNLENKRWNYEKDVLTGEFLISRDLFELICVKDNK